MSHHFIASCFSQLSWLTLTSGVYSKLRFQGQAVGGQGRLPETEGQHVSAFVWAAVV